MPNIFVRIMVNIIMSCQGHDYYDSMTTEISRSEYQDYYDRKYHGYYGSDYHGYYGSITIEIPRSNLPYLFDSDY